MNNHLRKLSLLGVILLLSALALFPVTQANRHGKTATFANNVRGINNLAAQTFVDTTAIRIPGVVGTTSGVASPYPSTIAVSGVSGPIENISVKLVDVNHTFPDDIDVLLVSPAGQKLIIMSDSGGGIDLVNTTITIEDSASSALPDGTAIVTGTFRPTNHVSGDLFQSVAAPYQSPEPIGAATITSVFGGEDPNGNWQLYIVDDGGGDQGNVNGGWELIFNQSSAVPPPCTVTCPNPIVVNTDPDSCTAVVNYSAMVEGSCGSVTYSHPSGSAFAVGTTTVTVTATQADMTTQSCSFNVTVTDADAPSLTTNVAASSLGHPFNHSLENVGLSGSASDNCSGVGAVQVEVFSDEDDEAGSDDGIFSPDATNIGLGTLRLRKERLGGGNGRVYLIISRATDGSGSGGYSCNTVTVPLSNSAAHKDAVNAEAAAALTYCQSSGTPPAGYLAVGDGQTIGPKQ